MTTKKPKNSDGKFLKLEIEVDENLEAFFLTFKDEFQTLLELTLSPDTFELLTNDMLKFVKNYNLERAKQYTEKRHNCEHIDFNDSINHIEHKIT